jgi:ribose-phosphate pyrophosphokinase
MTMTNPGILLYFEEEQDQATQIAAAAGMALACISRHRFPDGELKLRLPDILPQRVTVLRSLHQPNEKLLELLLVGRTARTLGAEHLTLVAPYLAYMRQDIAFQPGEAVSQRIVGKFLSDLFDDVITVDPHLHRVTTLQEAVPVPQAIVLSGAPLLADWIALHRKQPLLVGPDEESAQF